MKKLNLKTILVAIVLIVATGVIVSIMPKDYEDAYEKTNKLDSYKMEISTIVTITDGDVVKHSVIDQVVRVANKGKKSMRYEVVTNAQSTDGDDGLVSEVNSYTYHNKNYYCAYPGVKYKSPIEYDAAYENISNLTNVIAFAPEQMKNIRKENTDEGDMYVYEVDFEDVSTHVKAALQSAISQFGNANFSFEEIGAAAIVDKGYVKSREFYVSYTSGESRSVTLEVYTTLVNTKEKVEKPDESKYVDIMGK